MLLHPRQGVFVERSLRALDEHGETLGVAPTGAGKTIMLSAVVGRALDDEDAKACVLAHREEQNRAKFQRNIDGQRCPRALRRWSLQPWATRYRWTRT